jgi:hypothetical protein
MKMENAFLWRLQQHHYMGLVKPMVLVEQTRNGVIKNTIIKEHVAEPKNKVSL